MCYPFGGESVAMVRYIARLKNGGRNGKSRILSNFTFQEEDFLLDQFEFCSMVQF